MEKFRWITRGFHDPEGALAH
jgi:hypothetical protein